MSDELSLKEYVALVEANIRRDIMALTEHIREGQQQILAAVNSHEKRINRLENWRSGIIGGVSVIILFITLFLKFWR